MVPAELSNYMLSPKLIAHAFIKSRARVVKQPKWMDDNTDRERSDTNAALINYDILDTHRIHSMK